MAKFDKKLASVLAERGLLPEDQREGLMTEVERTNVSLTSLLLDRRVCAEADLVAAVAQEMNCAPINLEKAKPDRGALEQMTEEQCLKHEVLPISKMGKLLALAVADPFDVLKKDNLKLLTGCEIVYVISSAPALQKAVKEAYVAEVDTGEQMDLLLAGAERISGDVQLAEGLAEQELDLTDDIRSEGSPIVKMVNLLVLQGIEQHASDIHIEPFDKRLRVRYRLDGACHETPAPPKKYHPAVTSRIKIMANMDIAERRKPQDGKFQMRVRGRQVDFRVSVLPTIHGEKVCIRILDTAGLSLSLDTLGFEPESLADFRWAIAQPYGMLLVTGPTGSGKSTTLYSAIREVMRIEDNITTVEDPVEYQMDGVNQVQVNEKRGVTFASALRSILRQDPDIVMIGEVRDQETAEIAIRAALTGHLVLSTLHTNDAPSSVTRLVDMGVDAFMVANSLLVVSAQRLLRKLCTECREQFKPPVERMLRAGCQEQELEGATFFQPHGCGRCTAGYKGRFAILETMRLRDDIRRIVIEGGSSLDVRGKALEHGMITLRRCALLNAMRGKTSLEEVLTMTLDET